METHEEIDVVVIGSGFGGLGAGVRLQQQGTQRFVILEQADRVGGVWRENVYPGCACDVRVHLYSFSFFPNPDWSRAYAPQAEILSYLEQVVERFGLEPQLRFGHRVEEASWSQETARWTVRCANGKTFSARFVIAALGGLSRPTVPSLPGLERFGGTVFHSARWDHGWPLEGKRVGVVGTGASAIQFVPSVVERAAHVTVFQRTPPWILPRRDRAIGPRERWLYRHLPFLQRLRRWILYWAHEIRVPAFTQATWLMTLVAALARRHLATQVPDQRLREALTPDYRLGCKRVLLSDDYYPAVARPNCQLETSAIREVVEDGVVTTDGQRRRLDALIFGTGFSVTDVVGPVRIVGRLGALSERWRDGAKAWFGTAVHGFPNLFVLTGPNTGLGHSSMIFMIESQLAFVTQTIERVTRSGARWWEVRDDAEQTFSRAIQRKLQKSVWLSGCRSWYLDERGQNVTLWPGFTFTFRAGLSRFDEALHHLEGGHP